MCKTYMEKAIKLVRRHLKSLKWKERVRLSSSIGSFNVQRSTVSKLICRFNTIEINIPAWLYKELEHLITNVQARAKANSNSDNFEEKQMTNNKTCPSKYQNLL